MRNPSHAVVDVSVCAFHKSATARIALIEIKRRRFGERSCNFFVFVLLTLNEVKRKNLSARLTERVSRFLAPLGMTDFETNLSCGFNFGINLCLRAVCADRRFLRRC